MTDAQHQSDYSSVTVLFLLLSLPFTVCRSNPTGVESPLSTSVVPVRSIAQSAVLMTARTAGRLARPFLLPLRGLIAWPVSSQLEARRNALAAEHELARRRTEREEVARFLATLPARPVAVPTPRPMPDDVGEPVAELVRVEEKVPA